MMSVRDDPIIACAMQTGYAPWQLFGYAEEDEEEYLEEDLEDEEESEEEN